MAHDFRQSLERINDVLRYHTKLLEKIMQGEDDLKQAIADNKAAMLASVTEIETKIAALVAAATGDSDADIEDLANELKAETAQFKLSVSNALNPAPKPVQNQGGAADHIDGPADPSADPNATTSKSGKGSKNQT